MSCPSWSQHIVLIRYIHLWSFVTILLKIQKLWPMNNILPRREFNSKNSRVIVLFIPHSWWDKSFRDLSQAVVELWPYIHKLTTVGRFLHADSEHSDKTDGQTRCLQDDHFQQVVQYVEGKSEWKKKKKKKKHHAVSNVCQNRRPYRIETLFQFSASPPPILGTTENATLAHFMKKAMHLNTEFLLDYQVVLLLLNGPQIEKTFAV